MRVRGSYVTGLLIFTAIFVVALVVLRRHQSAGNSLPSQTKLLWLMVVVVALGVAVQALFAK